MRHVVVVVVWHCLAVSARIINNQELYVFVARTLGKALVCGVVW